MPPVSSVRTTSVISTSQQVPANGAWLRRVLRLPLPPRRHVGPLLVRLPPRLDRRVYARERSLQNSRRGVAYRMKVFLSHSTKVKEFVLQVPAAKASMSSVSA
jgi:hypothetical protein